MEQSAAFGLAPVGTMPQAVAPGQAPAGELVAFPLAFSRSAELGLLIALVLVAYIDGRILPRRARS